MDATIMAACISGGVGAVGILSTAVTAWIGSRNTRWATERTIDAGAAANRATLTAAREERLWERRAAAYEEALADVLHRQLKREHDLSRYQWDDASEQEAKEMFDAYGPPGFDAQGRLVAYGSDAVHAAFYDAACADSKLWAALVVHRVALRNAIPPTQDTSQPDGDPALHAEKKLEAALEAADSAYEALIKAIRDELRSRPEAAMLPALPAALPAVRRRFRLRHRELYR
jgi:hypothetical protein